MRRPASCVISVYRREIMVVLLCCRCCQAPVGFFPLPVLGTVSPRPEPSGGFWLTRSSASPMSFHPCECRHGRYRLPCSTADMSNHLRLTMANRGPVTS